MIEYRIARCLGEENVSTAIQDKMDENVGWRVHSIMVTNVEEHVLNPLQINKTIQVTRFLILFERVDISDVPMIRDTPDIRPLPGA
jgi:hypothetical protein